MTNRKPFRQLSVIFLGITIPAVVLLFFLHISSVRSVERNHEAVVRGYQSMIVASVEQTVDAANHDGNSSISCMDFLIFCNSSASNRVTRYASRVAGRLRYALSEYREVLGFVLYNAACDRYYYTDFAGNDPSLYGDLSFGTSQTAGHVTASIDLVTLDSRHLIALTYRQRHGFLVVLLDPQRNIYFQSYQTASDGTYSLVLRSLEEAYDRGSKIYQDFSLVPLRLEMQEQSGVGSAWKDTQHIIILLLILLIILSVILICYLMQVRLIAPLGLLWRSFDRISQGDTKYRIPDKTPMTEINDFYQGFNQMLDTLEEVRSQRDQSALDSAHARLQYFQLQIRPHFYLNCLKNIRAMASIHEDDKIQEMVILMSDYLRYIFQDNRNFLPLQEEIEAVQGYVDLCRLMGSPIDVLYEVNTDGLSSPALPMSILTFVENSIKHNKNLESLTIRITSKPFRSADGTLMQNITIRDNGNGFPPETLSALNTADPTELQYRRDHIGIANVRYRLWLVYGQKAGVSFRNEGSEAVVQVYFPTEPGTSTLPRI